MVCSNRIETQTATMCNRRALLTAAPGYGLWPSAEPVPARSGRTTISLNLAHHPPNFGQSSRIMHRAGARSPKRSTWDARGCGTATKTWCLTTLMLATLVSATGASAPSDLLDVLPASGATELPIKAIGKQQLNDRQQVPSLAWDLTKATNANASFDGPGDSRPERVEQLRRPNLATGEHGKSSLVARKQGDEASSGLEPLESAQTQLVPSTLNAENLLQLTSQLGDKTLDGQANVAEEPLVTADSKKKKKMMKKKKKMEKKHKEWKKGKKHKKKKYESKKKKGGMMKKKKGKKEKKKWGMEKKGHKKKGNFKKKKWGHKKKMKKGHKKGKKGHKMLKDKGHKKKGFKKVYHKEEWGKKKKWHDIKREKKWNTKQKKWKKKWHQEKGKKYKGKHMKKYHKKNKHGKKYKKEKKSKWKKHKGEKFKKGHKKKKEEYAKKKEGGKKKKMKKMKKEMKKKKG